MVTSDLSPEVEIRPFRACAMHAAIIIGTVRSLWTWLPLWGRYHVPQNAFLVFFISFSCFLQRVPRSHFLTDRNDLYAITRVSGQECAFWESRQYPTTFRGSNPQKTSPKWAGIGTSQSNRQNSKIAIYRSQWRYSCQISQTDWLQGPFLKKCKIRSDWVV